MDNENKVLNYLISVEKLAEEILADKQSIILLDKQRNKNREAFRELKQSSGNSTWITIGSILVKQNIKTASELLEDEQNQINIDINKLRSELKVKVNNLRDLEMQPPVPGLMLVPLSQKETEGLSKSGLW